MPKAVRPGGFLPAHAGRSVNVHTPQAQLVERGNIAAILPRMIRMALRKLSEDPGNAAPAVRMLLRNVIRLAVSHLGEAEAGAVALETFRERGR